ncbi:MAG: class I SAM-dependent methyltransferase [Terriglobia bacterium]
MSRMLNPDWSTKLRALVPQPIRTVLRPLWKAARLALYPVQYGFFPPPSGTDLVGYETLIDFMQTKQILGLPGDVVEVGAFCGGGTYKLARSLMRRHLSKKVYAIDCFDITFDETECTAGIRMPELYARSLRGRSQKEVFRKVTQGLRNVVVIAADSRTVTLPTDAVCFAFIDGNHAPDYVRNDFHLVWKKRSGSGVVAFHDYGYDLPMVTSTLDDLCGEHRNEIQESYVDAQKHILFIQKRRG